ncbi:hypothetical protein [Rubellicoccus peritrichatus]|uniref:O-antigen ligase domain-containing protein n=1 Tax=Rubellicoccus peritrichatus TaxID=3080537 RepID=A0AAQ3QUV4_9BACT|nr:hypothetical protein [Puniceicoccus sp. CR14]WOO40803.1 hypothetical protein RZN69_19440 [Puniceicoccus sp. CR14]
MAKASTRSIVKNLIWFYLFLLIFDGALRKWFLVPLADVLLISRVPLTFLIYLLALQGGFFVINGFVAGALLLGVATGAIALLLHGNVFIATFGIIANYASIPLIFIIPRVFDYYDTEKLGRVLLILVLPMTFIIGLQFYSPQEAWINRGVGGDEGTGFYGALDKYRPPGTFSFVTGIAQFYTLAFAYFIAQFINQRTLPHTFLYAIGAAFVLSIYLSISRLLALSMAVVFAGAMLGLVLNGRRIGNTFKVIIGLTVAYVIAAQLPIFDSATEAFFARWEAATGEEAGGVEEAIIMRTVSGFTDPFLYIDLTEPMGRGLGIGTNVGAKFAVGRRTFLAGEGEWFRIIAELGPIFGLGYIIYRIALAISLTSFSYRMLKRGNLLPWLICSSCFLLILNGQWGQQTTLSFAILSAGLVFSAGQMPRQSKQVNRTDQKQNTNEKKVKSHQPQMS